LQLCPLIAPDAFSKPHLAHVLVENPQLASLLDALQAMQPLRKTLRRNVSNSTTSAELLA
jgi:hypothetical protein